MTEKCLELKEIKKSFSKEETVLKEISLSIDKGEFITLLGSSGCGKTTTLRIIAGLETPDSGRVFLDGRDVTGLAPEARDVNTVFQNYALFPHMTVADNIGYGLKLKKTPKAEIKKRVSEMLDLVQLPGFEKRKPSELSGGQRHAADLTFRNVLHYIRRLYERTREMQEHYVEEKHIHRMKKYLVYTARGLPDTFDHYMKRAKTARDFMRICEDILDNDAPFAPTPPEDTHLFAHFHTLLAQEEACLPPGIQV